MPRPRNLFVVRELDKKPLVGSHDGARTPDPAQRLGERHALGVNEIGDHARRRSRLAFDAVQKDTAAAVASLANKGRCFSKVLHDVLRGRVCERHGLVVEVLQNRQEAQDGQRGQRGQRGPDLRRRHGKSADQRAREVGELSTAWMERGRGRGQAHTSTGRWDPQARTWG